MLQSPEAAITPVRNAKNIHGLPQSAKSFWQTAGERSRRREEAEFLI
jgi:hypothetical protein